MGTAEPAADAVGSGRSGREVGATRTFAPPTSGRVFRARRTVRLGEADPGGRLRLDAVARHLQDIASDDTADARDRDSEAWVVRRTLLEQRRPLRLDDVIELETFCTGTGSRWAERSTVLRAVDADELAGDAAISTATVWVHLDGTTGRPKVLPAGFDEVYGVAADREIAARQLHDPVAPGDDDVHTAPWWPRVTDLDVLDHVNNAVGWEIVEQTIARVRARGASGLDPEGGLAVEVEFRDAVDRSAVESAMPLTVAHRIAGDVLEISLWSTDAATVHLTAKVRPLGSS